MLKQVQQIASCLHSSLLEVGEESVGEGGEG